MTHEDIQADLSLFALDALDTDERGAIQEHLSSGCAACERELATWREVVGAMALNEHGGAPPDLKPALLQRLRPRPRLRVVPLRRPRRWVAMALPLAASVVAVLTFGVLRERALRRDLDTQRQVVIRTRNQLTAAQDTLQRLTQELAAKEEDLRALRAALAVVEEPGLQLAHLKQTPTAPPVEGHLLISATSGRALFYGFALPAAPPGKVYELWWITEREGPVDAGVFQPDAKGLGRVEATVPTEAGAIKASAVTIEPAGGVAKPTGPMILLGDVHGT